MLENAFVGLKDLGFLAELTVKENDPVAAETEFKVAMRVYPEIEQVTDVIKRTPAQVFPVRVISLGNYT